MNYTKQSLKNKPKSGGESDKSVKEMNQELRGLFLNQKPVDILVVLGRANKIHAKEISKRADATYSHTVKIMEKLQNNGLVTAEKVGRKKEFKLTLEGKKVAGCFMEMLGIVEDSKALKTSGKPRLGNHPVFS